MVQKQRWDPKTWNHFLQSPLFWRRCTIGNNFVTHATRGRNFYFDIVNRIGYRVILQKLSKDYDSYNDLSFRFEKILKTQKS